MILFSEAAVFRCFIVCVLEGNYNNELRDINFLSCSLDRDRIDNYSITQTDVTKNSFFFLNSKIPRTQVPPFFFALLHSLRECAKISLSSENSIL